MSTLFGSYHLFRFRHNIWTLSCHFSVPKGPSFADLVQVPVRKEPKKKRANNRKPPSFELTSTETMTFIKDKHDKEQQKKLEKEAREAKKKEKAKGQAKGNEKVKGQAKGDVPHTRTRTTVTTVGTGAPKKPVRQTRSTNPTKKRRFDKSIVCPSCKYYLGDPEDEGSDDWVSCKKCDAQYHDLCATAVKRCACGEQFKVI